MSLAQSTAEDPSPLRHPTPPFSSRNPHPGLQATCAWLLLGHSPSPNPAPGQTEITTDMLGGGRLQRARDYLLMTESSSHGLSASFRECLLAEKPGDSVTQNRRGFRDILQESKGLEWRETADPSPTPHKSLLGKSVNLGTGAFSSTGTKGHWGTGSMGASPPGEGSQSKDWDFTSWCCISSPLSDFSVTLKRQKSWSIKLGHHFIFHIQTKTKLIYTT